MRCTDVAIVGGGLAGSTTAAMLGRAGHAALLVDPHPVYPPDFRCEKLDESQVRLMQQTGLADSVLPFGARDGEVWVVRRGRLAEKRPSGRYGIMYDALVNRVRSAVPDGTIIHAKAAKISNSADRQHIVLSNGEEISARLVVLANGLNVGMRQNLGINRTIISPCQSISIGFDLVPVGRDAFDFPALTYHPQNAKSRIAYLAIFPVASAMRANMFVYWDQDDPRLRALRHEPEAALLALLPRLDRFLGPFRVSSVVKIRPVDLYVSTGMMQPGVVLVGDACGTSCPAEGTGTNKVLTDVVQLCTRHIPNWLSTPGMPTEKIAEFYRDPVKQACDASSIHRAHFERALSTDLSVPWRARRVTRIVAQFGLGAVRAARSRWLDGRASRPAPA
jgi:2-polyprenyl-6-methoxyphenol hydroxylase-like FAD-dependent oxidoreductase